MSPSASLCRTQSSIQEARAKSTTLANIRNLATVAAAAWSKEGDAADKREARQRAVKVQSALTALTNQAEWDGPFSNDPDLGMADGQLALSK